MTARWLGKNHRAIAVDLPGYGLSDKPLDINYDFAFYTEVLSGFLDALGIEKTDLVVRDLGGHRVSIGAPHPRPPRFLGEP